MRSRGITRHITDLDTNLIRLDNNATSSANSTQVNSLPEDLDISNECQSSQETIQTTEQDNNPHDIHAIGSSK